MENFPKAKECFATDFTLLTGTFNRLVDAYLRPFSKLMREKQRKLLDTFPITRKEDLLETFPSAVTDNKTKIDLPFIFLSNF